eukprot:TRINITY_DN37050_c0_g1_i1.p1 TRINITY_DN37050_c0_g1~~TRINITY_DN37050_c0_g1_i1.p1  ORF type:complete len:182 (+),score=29.12 TRINITY_DN37050_c0_g1_i1:83-628(+)
MHTNSESSSSSSSQLAMYGDESRPDAGVARLSQDPASGSAFANFVPDTLEVPLPRFGEQRAQTASCFGEQKPRGSHRRIRAMEESNTEGLFSLLQQASSILLAEPNRSAFAATVGRALSPEVRKWLKQEGRRLSTVLGYYGADFAVTSTPHGVYLTYLHAEAKSEYLYCATAAESFEYVVL